MGSISKRDPLQRNFTNSLIDTCVTLKDNVSDTSVTIASPKVTLVLL